MTVLFGKDKLIELKKKGNVFILLYLLPTLLFVGLVVLLFFLSNRHFKMLFSLLLSLVSTVYLAYILYISFIKLRRHLAYKKLCKSAIINKLSEVDVILNEIDDKVTTVDFIPCIGLHLYEVDDDFEILRFIPEECVKDFEKGKKYTLRYYHQFVIAYEVKEDE